MVTDGRGSCFCVLVTSVRATTARVTSIKREGGAATSYAWLLYGKEWDFWTLMRVSNPMLLAAVACVLNLGYYQPEQSNSAPQDL